MDESIAARATAAGVSPAAYAYELLMKDDGKGFIYFPILNYRDGNLNFLEDLQAADDTVNSLSDGGAHCGTICDAASPTFMLQHWVRDRKGHRIALEHAVKRQRSEEHTSELQSLMRISYAVFCLKKKKQHTNNNKAHTNTTNH